MTVNWLQLVQTLAASIIPLTVPGGAVLAPLVVQGIAQAEAAKGKTGAEKLQIAQQVVATGIAGINAVNSSVGHPLIDAHAISGVLAEGISTVVDVTNVVHAKAIAATGVAGGPLSPV